ncbi:MAG: hypothetical protein AMJ62_11645 [Myxococcales bacterium SG8_38]|nr:MAG: hypothetical protein AMJ62_11645 [Myxococcales bacterium SG8_38]
MTWTVVAAVVLGALSPVVRGLVWGVPVGFLSVATVLRSFIGSALTVLVIGGVAFFALRAAALPPEWVDMGTGLLGGVLGLLLLLSSARRMRDVRGLSILCQRLQEEDVRPQAMRALDRLLDRVRRENPQRYIALVLMATGPLTQAGMWNEARSRLRGLDDEVLTGPQSVLRNQALATCELQFDDIDAAQRAIDRISRPTESSIEVWLVALEALLMALRGDSERALGHLGTQDTEDNPSLRASHRLVRAHILASRSDEEAAVAELEMLRREAGRAGLERVVRPRGPASPLAEQLLQSENQSG